MEKELILPSSIKIESEFNEETNEMKSTISYQTIPAPTAEDFLGCEKYKPLIENIMLGLGIPKEIYNEMD